MMENRDFPAVPAEKLRFAQQPPVQAAAPVLPGRARRFRGVLRRFCRHRSSAAAAVILFLLVMYAALVPAFCRTDYTESAADTVRLAYAKLLPRCSLLADAGFWDGCANRTVSDADMLYYRAMAAETGRDPVKHLRGVRTDETGKTLYDVRIDSYAQLGIQFMTLTEEEYRGLQRQQDETGIQVIYPAVSRSSGDANLWCKADRRGVPTPAEGGSFVSDYRTEGSDGGYASLRLPGDPGQDDPEAPDRWRYAVVTGSSSVPSYIVRVSLFDYFACRCGEEPSFLFGTDDKGQDILLRLALAARFSLLLGLGVSLANLFIGLTYGAIEGYFGGAADFTMQRLSDVLAEAPFMVVAALFQLHFARKTGVVPALLFAFVLTGWIGIAERTRLQFYRFKSREYVQAARAVGAGDGRIMLRHILPNALGTVITSAVLLIPGVIFSESMLSYLGIVSLDGTGPASVGAMLAGGKPYLFSCPHIIFFPALLNSLLMIAFNLFGNGLRDAFDPAGKGGRS